MLTTLRDEISMEDCLRLKDVLLFMVSSLLCTLLIKELEKVLIQLCRVRSLMDLWFLL